MASIKRRKDKFCVIYNYTDTDGKRKEKAEMGDLCHQGRGTEAEERSRVQGKERHVCHSAVQNHEEPSSGIRGSVWERQMGDFYLREQRGFDQ